MQISLLLNIYEKSFLFLLTLSLAYTMQANEQEESYVP